MRIQVLPTAEAAAERAAQSLRAEIGRASASRGRCALALSGGKTARRMLHELARLRVHWHGVEVFQVDERVVAASDERRNARQIADLLIGPDALAPAAFHGMPVERQPLSDGAADYATLLRERCGTPPVLDVVQLGLGADGHTASLIAGDAMLEEESIDVGVSGVYQGVRRMTMTLRVLNGARHRLWLVTGSDKARALRALWDGDTAIPGGRVAREAAFVFADAEAAVALPVELRTPR